jgi:formate hydrogenlyase subunit 3/multisubunit Na+/H+ antiporter MnhD subunit
MARRLVEASAVMVVAGLGCPLILIIVAAFAIAGGRSPAATRAVYGACFVVSLAACAVAFAGLADGTRGGTALTLPLGLPWLGAHFRLDRLSAFFLLVVNLANALASLYALGYAADDPARERVLSFFPAFLAGMNLVLLADDAFTFLFSWEFMSLTSWALVLKEHEREETRSAAYLYLIMAAIGTAALLLCFGLLAGPGGAYGFAAIRLREHGSLATALILVLALVGAGSKSGLLPLHVWLPPAHAAAPSHVSALMSGVMTKVAVYAAVRLLFDLAGPPAWWWGAVVMIVGGVSAVMGLLYALMQSDLKRLLAYSTVENLGVIYVCLGLALTFAASGLPAGAALALTAGLLHALNHALFKGLLFMGAGAVLHGTGGERDMERLGGLIHRLPVTGFLFLVGAAAISALPPLNGFVSEWLLFHAILGSTALPLGFLRFLAPAVGALMALAAALAAACFVRAYGITFLGRPRSEAARTAHEIARPARAAMGIAAALCCVLGVFPGPVIDLIGGAVSETVGTRLPEQGAQGWLSLVPVSPAAGSYNGLVLLVFITISSLAVVFFVHRFASARLRRAPAWDCGFPDSSSATQYTASSFAQPLRRVFGSYAFLVREEVDMPGPGDTRPAVFRLRWHDVVWEGAYAPVATALGRITERLNALQFLTIRRYLTLVFGALILLLLVVATWR